MNNKEIVKCILAGYPVTDGSRIFPSVVDYTITYQEDGTVTNTAGCIDENRVYHVLPYEGLSCSEDLSVVPKRTPPWLSSYDVKVFMDAMEKRVPATVSGLHYSRVDKLSVKRMPGRIDERLRYVVRCVDEQGNTLTARAEAVRFDGIEIEEPENEPSADESAA